jgi:hypothetical protein
MSSGESAPEVGGLRRIPFSAEAEKQITALSFWLGLMGWLGVLAGVIDVLNIVLSSRNFGNIFNAILHVVIGVWCLQAAAAFKKVATTDVADQAYLLEGFSKLRRIFLVQGILILVALAFVAAVLLFVIVYGVNAR